MAISKDNVKVQVMKEIDKLYTSASSSAKEVQTTRLQREERERHWDLKFTFYNVFDSIP